MLERPISQAGLTRVAFGDVVRKVNDKVDPWDSGLERYVAGEHMDTDDLRIRRWGLIGDDYLGPAFHMRFKPGHVLYGSRRTYLRKVALADFEGITANTTFVLETKDAGRLMPDLLPFLMQTEMFHAYSIRLSKGSVNPYINFSDLEAFEFMLPPIQEQARLVQAATQCRAAVDALQDASGAAALAALAFGKSIAETLSKQCPLVPVGDISEVQYGLTVNQQRAVSSVCKPYLRVANVQRGWFDLAEIKEIGVSGGDEVHALEFGDVLVVEGHATRSEIGRAAMWRNEINGALHQNHLIRIRTLGAMNSRFVCEMINSPHGQQYFQTHAKSSSGLNTINSSVVRKYQIPQPSTKTQNEIVSKLENITSERKGLLRRLGSARCLMKEFLAGIEEGLG